MRGRPGWHRRGCVCRAICQPQRRPRAAGRGRGSWPPPPPPQGSHWPRIIPVPAAPKDSAGAAPLTSGSSLRGSSFCHCFSKPAILLHTWSRSRFVTRVQLVPDRPQPPPRGDAFAQPRPKHLEGHRLPSWSQSARCWRKAELLRSVPCSTAVTSASPAGAGRALLPIPLICHRFWPHPGAATSSWSRWDQSNLRSFCPRAERCSQASAPAGPTPPTPCRVGPPAAGGLWGSLSAHSALSPRVSGGGRAARTAALLVRVVPAVVVVVALPAARHAAVVLAAELVGLAGAFVWEGWRQACISIAHAAGVSRSHAAEQEELLTALPHPGGLRRRSRRPAAPGAALPLGMGEHWRALGLTPSPPALTHRIPPWAHQTHPRSHPPHRTSSVLGCTFPSPCSGTHPRHTSFVLGRNKRTSMRGGGHWHCSVTSPRGSPTLCPCS